MYSGDEFYGDDITSGQFADEDQVSAGSHLDDFGHASDEEFEGELDQADFEHEMEDAEDGL